MGLTGPCQRAAKVMHMNDYKTALETLREKALVYRCFKTRKEIMEDIARAPHYHGEPYTGQETPLSGDEENSLLAAGKPYAWRLSLRACQEYLGREYDRLSFVNNGAEMEAKPALLGDVILARKDVGTSYHLACCYDDALQGITDIVRGVDLLESTHIHRLLQALMDWPVPKYHHHELITDADGKRYAKRDQSVTLRALRQTGALPENILAQVTSLG